MDVLPSQIFAPTTLQELFYSWERCPQAVPYAGGTELEGGQGGRSLNLPENTLSLSNIQELRRVTRTERYLEVGAMVTLNELLALGKILPRALRLAIAETANPQIRNLATIGGNLCAKGRRMDCFAPLSLLDARLELRTEDNSRWIPCSRFASAPGAPMIDKQELLTRIRIPLEHWDYVVHRRLGQKHFNGADAASFSFISHIQKGILSDLRLALACTTFIRDRQLENALVGKALPLSRKEVQDYVGRWRERIELMDYLAPLVKDQFLNLIEYSVQGLSD